MTNDAAEVPVILIHGYFHNHSGLMVMKRSLRKHGFKHVRAFTYNPLRRGIPEMAECVRDRVQEIKRTTGARKVHLVGHSLGGILARYYVEQMDGAKSVKTLVTLGTPHSGTLVAYAGRSPAARQLRPGSEVLRRLEVARKPKKVRYVSYYSNLDALIVPASSAILRSEDATNIKLKDLGHLSMLISPQVISSIAWQLSNGGRV